MAWRLGVVGRSSAVMARSHLGSDIARGLTQDGLLRVDATFRLGKVLSGKGLTFHSGEKNWFIGRSVVLSPPLLLCWGVAGRPLTADRNLDPSSGGSYLQ